MAQANVGLEIGQNPAWLSKSVNNVASLKKKAAVIGWENDTEIAFSTSYLFDGRQPAGFWNGFVPLSKNLDQFLYLHFFT